MTVTHVPPLTDAPRTPPALPEADHDHAPTGYPAHPAHTIRADRTDPRWSVRVVLEGTATAAGGTTDSVGVIVHDRDAGTFPVFRVWSDWRDPAILATHIGVKPLTEALRATEAEGLAGALIAWLMGDATACIAALTPKDAAPARVRPITRREREQQQLLHDIAWHE